ncbi:hypothetical protein DAI22_12g085732 [Oryza sativa Japonica Group]|nr:hypothetical protein DAI22_12g085732 [Oryza sativa Japonica Group]
MELGGAAWRSSMSPAQTQPLISLLTSPPSASTAPGSGNLRGQRRPVPPHLLLHPPAPDAGGPLPPSSPCPVGCSSASNIRHASSSGHIAKMKALFKSKPGMLASVIQQTHELLIFVDLHSGSRGVVDMRSL